jgi:SNF2 family DNA or RNA helicase
MMLRREQLHSYQNTALEFIKNKKRCMLILEMGLGKTTTSLTAVSDLLDDFAVNNVLVIAPLRVANTVWKQEAEKWEHLRDLSFQIATGDAPSRRKALQSESDIHVINVDNIPWLVDNYQDTWKWDCIIIDESTKFKNYSSKRFKALKKILKHTSHIIELTGTPSPKSYEDLWSQVYILDQGERLGRNITQFRAKYCQSGIGFKGYGYEVRNESKAIIRDSISDLAITMKAEDYLELPDRIDIRRRVELPQQIKKQYKELEKEMILTLEEDINIIAPSGSAITNKLTQLCNGAVYDDDSNYHVIHDEKINAIKEIREEYPEENLLVAYSFLSDKERLLKAFPEAVELDKKGQQLERWNNGEIPILLAHPASAGHGLNAQKGGSVVVWFGLPWSLELYQQFNARLHRQGQTKCVRVVHITAKGTIDDKIASALCSKATTQDELMNHFRELLL